MLLFISGHTQEAGVYEVSPGEVFEVPDAPLDTLPAWLVVVPPVPPKAHKDPVKDGGN